MRLHHFLSAAGVCSRREGERLIVAGRVRVNNQLITALGTTVDPRLDHVEVLKDSQKNVWHKVTQTDTMVVYALHKPAGYTTTVKDPHAEKTVMELLPKEPRVVPIGRLDKDSEGLLLLSNNGDLVHRLTHPSHHITKTYRVVAKFPSHYHKPALLQNIAKLAGGIMLDGKMTSPASIHIVSTDWKTADTITLECIITEGINRQIRKMCQKIGLNVIQLVRTQVGKLELSDLHLKQGQYTILSAKQISLLS